MYINSYQDFDYISGLEALVLQLVLVLIYSVSPIVITLTKLDSGLCSKCVPGTEETTLVANGKDTHDNDRQMIVSRSYMVSYLQERSV